MRLFQFPNISNSKEIIFNFMKEFKLSDLPIPKPVEIFDICDTGLVIISINAGWNEAIPKLDINLKKLLKYCTQQKKEKEIYFYYF